MLAKVLEFFQSELEIYFKRNGIGNPKIGFPDESEVKESINFVDDSLNIVMVNLEEENTLRQSDAFRTERQGKMVKVHPEVRLNMYVLFVANRKDYLTSLELLSLIIQFFQSRRVITADQFPGMPPSTEKLTVELVTMPFAQQNEVWNALRTSYKPSVLYKVRMLVFQEQQLITEQPPIQQIDIQT